MIQPTHKFVYHDDILLTSNEKCLLHVIPAGPNQMEEAKNAAKDLIIKHHNRRVYMLKATTIAIVDVDAKVILEDDANCSECIDPGNETCTTVCTQKDDACYTESEESKASE